MNMRLFFLSSLCLTPLLLTACVKGVALGTDADDAFAVFQREGPQVSGVEATLLKNAEAMTARGDHGKAVPMYQQLISYDEENVGYALALADAFRRSGDTDNAGQLYDLIIEKEEGNLDAMEGKALMLLTRGEFDKAGTLLSTIHTEDKTRWRTLNGLGILLVERGMTEDAVAYFNEALKQDKNNISVLNNIGLAYAITDDPAKAVSSLKKALDVAPPKSPLKKNLSLNMALIMGIYGDMDTAERILTEYLPESGVANNLGTYAYLSQNETLAKSYLNTALSQNPRHYERAWTNLQTITEQSQGTDDGKKTRNSRKAKVVKVPSAK